MYDKFSEELLGGLCPLLESFSLKEASAEAVLRSRTIAITDAINVLSGYFAEHPSGDALEEVHYFKSVYPKFKSLLVYYTEHHLFSCGVPELGGKAKKRYFLARLKAISGFLEKHQLHYDYYRLDGSMLDGIFYTRKDPSNILQPLVSGYDPFLGTPMSELVSWFMAYERLRNEILGQLHDLAGKLPVSHTSVSASGGLEHEIKWTGGDIHLIELVHGIHLTGQVNNGEIGIVELFRVVGNFFGVNLRVPKRGFDDLKARKTMSRTSFLDMMRAALLKKMDDDDAFDPEKTRRRNGF